MKTSRLVSVAVGVMASAALLAGCSGVLQSAAPSAPSSANNLASRRTTVW